MSKYKEYTGSECKEYPGFILYPLYHRVGKMPWAAAAVMPMDRVEKLIWVSGATGRDPDSDAEPRTWEEERKSICKVVGGIKEQTIATWTRIMEVLEAVGSKLEDIAVIYYYLADRDDWWDMIETTNTFWREHCPDLLENPRAGVLLKGIKLDFTEMLIEIEVVAATGKK